MAKRSKTLTGAFKGAGMSRSSMKAVEGMRGPSFQEQVAHEAMIANPVSVPNPSAPQRYVSPITITRPGMGGNENITFRNADEAVRFHNTMDPRNAAFRASRDGAQPIVQPGPIAAPEVPARQPTGLERMQQFRTASVTSTLQPQQEIVSADEFLNTQGVDANISTYRGRSADRGAFAKYDRQRKEFREAFADTLASHGDQPWESMNDYMAAVQDTPGYSPFIHEYAKQLALKMMPKSLKEQREMQRSNEAWKNAEPGEFVNVGGRLVQKPEQEPGIDQQVDQSLWVAEQQAERLRQQNPDAEIRIVPKGQGFAAELVEPESETTPFTGMGNDRFQSLKPKDQHTIMRSIAELEAGIGIESPTVEEAAKAGTTVQGLMAERQRKARETAQFYRDYYGMTPEPQTSSMGEPMPDNLPQDVTERTQVIADALDQQEQSMTPPQTAEEQQAKVARDTARQLARDVVQILNDPNSTDEEKQAALQVQRQIEQFWRNISAQSAKENAQTAAKPAPTISPDEVVYHAGI